MVKVKRAKVLFYAEKKNEMHYMSDIIAILLTFLSLLISQPQKKSGPHIKMKKDLKGIT